MLSCLIKTRVPKHSLQTKTVEDIKKEAVQELAQDLARADDDGFAIPEKIRGILSK